MNQLKNTKILITGGAGFIGSHLTVRLCHDYQIVILDNFRRDSLSTLPELAKHPNVKLIRGDILDKTLLSQAMKGVDIVIHMAALAGVSTYYAEPCETLRVNLQGTMNVLEVCKNSDVRRVIDFSTSEVYGADAYNVTEEAIHGIGPVTDLRWTYAISKLASEQLTLRYAEKYGFKAITVRPFNIYGPRQTGEGAISNFMRAVVNKKPLVIYGDGSAIRAWCYVSDCIDALETLIESDSIENGPFNIGNPREIYSTLGLARLICQVVNQDIPIIFKDVARTEIRVRVPNIAKARGLLNFEPKIDLITGLELTFNDFKQQH